MVYRYGESKQLRPIIRFYQIETFNLHLLRISSMRQSRFVLSSVCPGTQCWSTLLESICPKFASLAGLRADSPRERPRSGSGHQCHRCQGQLRPRPHPGQLHRPGGRQADVPAQFSRAPQRPAAGRACVCGQSTSSAQHICQQRCARDCAPPQHPAAGFARHTGRDAVHRKEAHG